MFTFPGPDDTMKCNIMLVRGVLLAALKDPQRSASPSSAKAIGLRHQSGCNLHNVCRWAKTDSTRAYVRFRHCLPATAPDHLDTRIPKEDPFQDCSRVMAARVKYFSLVYAPGIDQRLRGVSVVPERHAKRTAAQDAEFSRSCRLDIAEQLPTKHQRTFSHRRGANLAGLTLQAQLQADSIQASGTTGHFGASQ